MRIIAGQFRGRRLLCPDGQTTRPITDRAKQSLFDVLSPRIDGARVFDCFAGTGSMGLECLSRGAVHATFFESDPLALKDLRSNIQALGVVAAATVIGGDLFRHFAGATASHGQADLIFLDPPYRYLVDQADELRRVAALLAGCMATDALLIFRHAATDHLDLPPLIIHDTRSYGSMTVELLMRTAPQA